MCVNWILFGDNSANPKALHPKLQEPCLPAYDLILATVYRDLLWGQRAGDHC